MVSAATCSPNSCGIPDAAAIYAQATSENFPVASRLLPAAVRADLMAVYGFARLADDIGDEAPGDRLGMLRWLEEELERSTTATATHPVLRRLGRTIASRHLALQPFRDLIEANRRDQTVSRYATFDDLIGYCSLSAAPVGRVVLGVLGATTPERIRWADDVCNGLQVVEHLQDVAEDLAQDRIYLPLDDLTAAGCTEADLAAPVAGPALRAVVAQQVERARALLASGAPLAASLPWRPRVAVAGFAAGGMAALDAIERAGCDVLSQRCPPAPTRVVVRLVEVLSMSTSHRRATSPGWCRPTLGEKAHVSTSAGSTALDHAYATCEAITRREAKNFAYGIRLLKPPERRALSAVYALARRIDDIGDGGTPANRKLAALSEVRKSLDALEDHRDDPVLLAIGDVERRYGLPLDAFADLVDGCEMDVVGTTYATRDQLIVYCRRVAGSIGRLSLAVFGSASLPGAKGLADDLGVALQLTNILRDVREDAARGRVYLPADDAATVGCADIAADLTAGVADPAALARVVAFECRRAQEWFDRGLQLLPLLDRRSQACVGAMSGIYRRLLHRIERDPVAVTHSRVSVPAPEKLWVAVRCLTVTDRPRPVPHHRPAVGS